jgi:hypothetical protein
MAGLVRRCLFSIALVMAPAAAAQEAPQTPAPEIVVTGQRDLDQEVADFVQALTPAAPGAKQLSRFEHRICPAAAGLSPEQNRVVVERIRRVAKAAGLGVDKPKCRANIVVLLTRDKRALIETLARRHPAYLGDLSRREVRRLAETPGPAAAWHLAGPPRTADGTELPEQDGVFINRTTRVASRITMAVRPQTAAAIVVVETGALTGLTTTQLADYAAMRTLVRSDPAALTASAAPTILKALDAPMGSEVPVTLTRWDMGALRAAYESPLNLRAAAERSEIQRRLAESLQEAEPEQRNAPRP